MAGPLLECSWGRIRLFASEVHTDGGRTQVVHELSSGDVHPVQDRGLRIRRVRCKLQFDTFPGQPAPLDAALAMEAAKNSGQTAIFQHPLIGRFPASIGEYMAEIDASSVISAEAEFIQEAADIAVTPTGAASSGTSGESSATAAAQAADVELAQTGQLKMSSVAAAAILAKTSGGSKLLAALNTGRGTFDMSVGAASALATAIANQVTSNANRVSSEISAALGAPVNAEFALFGAASALSALSVSAGARSLVLAGRVPTPSGAFDGDAQTATAAAATSEVQQGLFSATTIDARVAVTSWQTGNVPTRQIMIDAARISNNIATMIEVGGFENDLALWPAFRAAIMLGESIRSAAISATSETSSVFVMRVVQPTALLPLAARIYGGAAATERARQISGLNDIATPGWLTPGDYLMPTRPPGAAF